jgi:hypothetical protein
MSIWNRLYKPAARLARGQLDSFSHPRLSESFHSGSVSRQFHQQQPASRRRLEARKAYFLRSRKKRAELVESYKSEVEKLRELRFRKFMAPSSGGQSESSSQQQEGGGIQDTNNPAGASGLDAEAQSFSKRFEGWFKSSDQMDPHGMGMFVRLFERREPRKFGPVWHAWQLFIACIPSIIIITVANNVKGLEVPEEKFVSRDELVKYKQLKAMDNASREEEEGGAAHQQVHDTRAVPMQGSSATQEQETRAADVAASRPDAHAGGDIAAVKAELEALKAEVAGFRAWKEAQKQTEPAPSVGGQGKP